MSCVVCSDNVLLCACTACFAVDKMKPRLLVSVSVYLHRKNLSSGRGERWKDICTYSPVFSPPLSLPILLPSLYQLYSPRPSSPVSGWVITLLTRGCERTTNVVVNDAVAKQDTSIHTAAAPTGTSSWSPPIGDRPGPSPTLLRVIHSPANPPSQRSTAGGLPWVTHPHSPH